MIVSGLVLGSCGSSNDVVNGGLLSKRKYTKGYHTNFSKNLKSSQPVISSEEYTSEVTNEKDLSVKNNQVESPKTIEITTESTTNPVVPQLITEENSEETVNKENTRTSTFGKHNEAVKTENNKQFGEKSEKTLKSFSKAMRKMSPAPGGDSSFIRVLIILILVLVAIALLQMLLPGVLIGNVLSLLLLILVVYLILRLFGVV